MKVTVPPRVVSIGIFIAINILLITYCLPIIDGLFSGYSTKPSSNIIFGPFVLLFLCILDGFMFIKIFFLKEPYQKNNLQKSHLNTILDLGIIVGITMVVVITFFILGSINPELCGLLVVYTMAWGMNYISRK
jgi:hypothetical protein